MKWHEIKITTTREAYDAISDMLVSIGAGGVAIEDPYDIRQEIQKPNTLDYADDEFINNLGEDVIIKAYFPGDANMAELSGLIKEKLAYIGSFLDVGQGYTGYSDVSDEDWANSWKKYYKPLRISERIVVKPSWEEYNAGPEDIVIELDPGMAFGTGTHETTKLCIQLLEKYLKPGDIALDVGCGTGILSIAAAKLDSGSITAVDVDDVAVRVTKENCVLNGVNGVVNAFTGELKDIETVKADIIIANIIADVIVGISKLVPDYLKTGGFFITSGIIKERKQDVVDTYMKLGFTCEAVEELGEWVAMVFKCQGSL